MSIKRLDTGKFIRDLDFISAVTRETLSSLELSTLLRRIVRLLHERFGYDHALIGLVDDNQLIIRSGAGGALNEKFLESGHAPIWTVPLGRGISGTTAATNQPHLCNNVKIDENYLPSELLPETKSELAVPLIHRDAVLGVLDVQSNIANAFDETDLQLLNIVAALVSPAVRIASLYERERTRSRHLHLASEISQLVMSSLDRPHIVSLACEAIIEALDVSFVGITLLDRTGKKVAYSGYKSRVPFLRNPDFMQEIGTGLVGSAVAAGKTIIIHDTSQFPQFLHVVENSQSALCVPLKVRGRIIGTVEVEHQNKNRFSEEDEHLLESISVYLAQAAENAQLFDDTRRRWQQLLVISETVRLATETYNLDDILRLVAQEVHYRFGYFAVAVLITEEREAVIKALKCDEELSVKVGLRYALSSSLVEQAVLTGKMIYAPSAQQIPASTAMRSDIQSVLCVPLKAQDAVIGAIEVQSRERDRFNEEDRLVMETLANSVASVIASARSRRQAEQLREDLNRMIVHDLRNPVQAVLLTLQEVNRVAPQLFAEQMVDAVNESIHCTEEVLEMINSLLDVARFEAGKAQVQLSPSVLNDHIRAVVRRFAPHARTKGVQVTTVLSPDVPVLRFDQGLVNRTLANLVGNAMKFSPDRSRITIRSELHDQNLTNCPTPPPFVLVAVQDNGEGVPREYHKKIFENFGQVETRKAGLKMSTGLGLSLCRFVVEAHHGAIWVESTPGQGSIFYFTLPVYR